MGLLNYVGQDFSRPGKPTDNALVETFNSRSRQECLNEHWFLSLRTQKRKLEHGEQITIQIDHIVTWLQITKRIYERFIILICIYQILLIIFSFSLDPKRGQVHR